MLLLFYSGETQYYNTVLCQELDPGLDIAAVSL